MFKTLLNRKTSKFDVIMALSAAVVAVWKAFDTVQDFKADQAEADKEIEK